MRSGGLRGLQILRSGVSVRGGFDSHAFPPSFVAVVAVLCALGPAVARGAAAPMAAGDSVVKAASPPAERASNPAPARADSAARLFVEPTDTTATPEDQAGAWDEADSVRTGPRKPRTLPPEARFDQPHWVMLRSLVVPGWGQAHNHAWIKAALVAVGDGVMRVRLIHDERRLSNLNGVAKDRLGTLAMTTDQVAAAQAELAAAQASGDQARIDAAEAALAVANIANREASDAYNRAVAVYNTLLDQAISRRWVAAGVLAYALLDAYIDAHFRSFDADFRIDPALPGETKPAGAHLRLGWRF